MPGGCTKGGLMMGSANAFRLPRRRRVAAFVTRVIAKVISAKRSIAILATCNSPPLQNPPLAAPQKLKLYIQQWRVPTDEHLAFFIPGGDPIKWMGSIQWQVDDLIYSIFNLMYLSAYQEFGAVVSAFL